MGLAQVCIVPSMRDEGSARRFSFDDSDLDDSNDDSNDDNQSPYMKKLEFMFRIYDLDRDGFISNEELFTVLKMMTGDNLTDLQLHQIVNRTILYLDKDTDGKISLEEFTQVIIERGTESGIWSILSENAARV